MAFQNTYQTNKFNAQDIPSVNTNSIPMFNNDMCLRMSFMNDSMSLRFIPAVTDETGTKRYPRDTGTWCVLKIEYAILLLNWLNQYFLPIAKSNLNIQREDPNANLEPAMVGIPTNKENTNMLVFKYDKPKNGVMVPTLTLHTGIDMTRKPANSVTYEFGTKGIFTEYDADTGEYVQSMEQVQFWVFYRALNHFVDAATMAEAHAQKLGSSYVNREMRDLIRQIASKNGIQVYQYNNQYSNSKDNKPNFTENSVPAEVSLNDMMSLPNGDDLPF